MTPKYNNAVYVLLDRSGSMSSGWQTTLEAINGYVAKLPKDTYVFLASFDCGGFAIHRQTLAQAYNLLTTQEVSPRGMTPLYDAVGKTTDQMLLDDAKRAVLVVMTDGMENQSTEYTLDAVKGKLKLLEGKDWPVVYLGADFTDVTKYAGATFAVNAANTMNTTVRNRGYTLDTYAIKTSSYFCSGKGTPLSASAMHLTDEEKDEINKRA